MIKYTCLIILLVLPLFFYSQNSIGLPDVLNYSKFDYNGGLQNWDIKQDDKGIMYFANNEGLLTFNGKYWNIYPLPNKTNVRSIEIGTRQRIYIGGQDELGYFSADDYGKLQFHSLISFIPEKDRIFGDVWEIVKLNDEIYCRTVFKVFKITGEHEVQAFSANIEWLFLGVHQNKVYAQDKKMGLLVFENNRWQNFLLQNDIPENEHITSLLTINDSTAILTTLKNGLFTLQGNKITKINSPNNALFEKERIFNAALINQETIALGTSTNGLHIIDINGNIIQNFSKTEGLHNKNVLSVFPDRQSNLWLGLDNGIDFIGYNSAIKHINPFFQDESGYAAIISKNNLYIGTSNGLCYVPLQNNRDFSFSRGNFNYVKNINGQCWSLTEIKDKLLLGHHEGAFQIVNQTALPLANATGFWNFTPVNDAASSNIISGTYRGISILNFDLQQRFLAEFSINTLLETARFVAVDKNNTIWLSHPYHGVYKLMPKNDNTYASSIYTSTKGLPSTLNNHVYKLNDKVVVATIKGIYQYNYDKDVFEKDIFYDKILGDISIRYLKEDQNGNIWFISEKTLNVIDFSTTTPKIIPITELSNKLLSGFEFIYPYNKNNIFIAGITGLYHINYEKFKANLPELYVNISSVTIYNKRDSILFGGFPTEQMTKNGFVPTINHKWNVLRFEFAAPAYGYQNSMEYSFYLKGFDKSWSVWSKRTEKEYTNLPTGTYTFQVKVRSNLGNESKVVSFTFKILPPWYQTTTAYLIYFLLIIGCIYAIIRWQKKKFIRQQAKFDEEQKKLLYVMELEKNKKESEIVALQNEKLEADINFQTTELATSAMHLVKKGELINKIKAELALVMKEIDNKPALQEIKKLNKALQEEDNLDKEWEHFAKHFDKVHSNFLLTLKEKHHSISPNELKLCAYLRMNLTSKEIAQLMNISLRGVEVSRYRLRKKLQLPTETSLFDYLIEI